jgi:hypothetical protein
MQFTTKPDAHLYRRSEEQMFPALRGRLKVVPATATRWDRKTGEPYTVSVWTVVIR